MTPDVRVGGSTPAENIPVWDADPAASEYMDFLCFLKGYAGGGLEINLPFMMSSQAGTNGIRFEAAIRYLEEDVDDLDASHTYVFQGVSYDPVPSAAGEVGIAVVTMTDGAQMDSLVDGGVFILRVYRDHDHADDDSTGDLELMVPVIIEA
jgi:hypothetical protein